MPRKAARGQMLPVAAQPEQRASQDLSRHIHKVWYKKNDTKPPTFNIEVSLGRGQDSTRVPLLGMLRFKRAGLARRPDASAMARQGCLALSSRTVLSATAVSLARIGSGLRWLSHLVTQAVRQKRRDKLLCVLYRQGPPCRMPGAHARHVSTAFQDPHLFILGGNAAELLLLDDAIGARL